jgi:flagellar motor switch protein FliN/FliY
MVPNEDDLTPDEIDGLMQTDDEEAPEETEDHEAEMLAAMGGVRPTFDDDEEEEEEEEAGGARDEVQAEPFELPQLGGGGEVSASQNLNMLMDVQLPVVVELGRTKKLVKEILQLQRGSVITLDKMAGEPANLVINGTIMASGEIVVIDDNFGIRITNMVSRLDRLKQL